MRPKKPTQAPTEDGRGFVDCFGLTVRKLREGQGWSQEQLAEHSQLNRSYVGEIERGSVVASLLTVRKLAEAMQLSPAGLLARCEQTEPQAPSLPMSPSAN